jgi:DNA polymerase-1
MEIKEAGSQHVLASLMDYCQETYSIMSVLPKMSADEVKKIGPEDWLAQSDAILDNAKSNYDRILCIGPIATASVMGAEKTVKITKVRGRGMYTANGVYCVPTFSFSTIFKDPDLYRDFEIDLLKCVQNKAPLPEPRIDLEILETEDELYHLDQLREATLVSCDIETTGFNPQRARMLSIGFCALYEGENAGKVIIVPEDLLGRRRSHVAKFLKTYKGTFIFHNFKFDIQHIWKRYGQFYPHRVDDTMLMGYAHDERPFNRYKHLSLKDMSRVYFDAPDYGLNMKEWLSEYRTAGEYDRGKLLEELYDYQAKDCYYTAALHPVLDEEMDEESPRLRNYHDNTLIPVSFALAQMEYTGVPVNVPYLENMRDELYVQLEDEMKEIRKIVCKHTNHPKQEEFNPNSPKQVAEVLYNAGDEGGLGLAMPKDAGRYAYKREAGKVTTNSDTLKVLARQVKKSQPAAAKLINLILSYRVKTRIAGTYVEGLLERVDPDGRIRGDFNIHGTATGRLSCSNPNLQNIPDASHVGFDIRKAYIPSPGWVMLEADYSQLELRVAALYSQDPILLDAYRNGADIHQEVAFMLWNKPKEEITKYERYLAKCMNFGVIYGRGARSIATGPEMDNLVEMSGRSWNEKEIDAYFAKFKEGYSSLFEWMALVSDDGFSKKYVEGPLGSRRRWGLVRKGDQAGILRQIANTPIQGFAAQMTSRAVALLTKRFNQKKQRVLFTVHDSIMCECLDDPDVIRDTGQIIQDVMENHLPEDAVVSFPVLDHAPFKQGDRLLYNLPFVSDVLVGKNWGECKHSWDDVPAIAANA